MSSAERFKTLHSRIAYQNNWMTVREDTFQRADGSEGLYGVIDRADFAVVIPIQDGRVHLVEQYRYTIGLRQVEFPQGALGRDEIAKPEFIAREELRQETGFEAGRLIPLGSTFPCYGMANQRMHSFVATDLHAVGKAMEPDELDLVSFDIALAELASWFRDGRIRDNASLAAYALYLLKKDELGDD
ncbi:MAG: ADP-ribose pyrophosphatase [Geminicoccaceae bacterium]